jgi:hypothetical protein
VIGLGLFALANAGLSLLLSTRLQSLGDAFHAPRLACLRRRVVHARPRPCTVLMLGSSQTHYGLRAGALEQRLTRQSGGPVVAYNLGKPGGGPLMSLYTWGRLRREGIIPDLLLLEVVPFMYGDALPVDEIDEARLPITALSLLDQSFLDSYNPERAAHLRQDRLTLRLFPWLGYRRMLLNDTLPWLLQRPLRDEPLPIVNESGDGPGWQLSASRERRREAALYNARNFSAGFQGAMPGERQASAARQLLRECRQHGVRVVVILMPEPELFRTCWPADKVAALESFLRSTAAEYGAEVADARRWLTDDDFADGLHMFPDAAERFTERLGREVVWPRMQARR